MRRILPFLSCVLLSCCLALLGAQQVHASHIQGGQITYRYVSGDTYEVTVSFYRDCTGASLPTTLPITAVSSCGGTAVTGILQSVPGTNSIGMAYCPSVQALATCNPASIMYPNYERQDYRGTINLPPAANWTIAYDDCCRPSTANLPTQDNFRFEATLNNLLAPVGGVATRANNSSPLFSSRDFPIAFVTVNQSTSLNFTSVSEADGDSLVYQLDQPLSSCGIFNPYAARPTGTGTCVTTVLPPRAPNTICLLDCGTSIGANFTAQLPIPVAVDTLGFCGTVAGTAYTRTVSPRFRFNPRNGEFTFTPNLYRTGASALGLNKYVVVGKITEYRRLPGSNRRYRVGSVRRDMLVIVVNSSVGTGTGTVANSIPNPPTLDYVTPGSQATVTATTDSTVINVFTCSYTQVRLRFTDPNPADVLTVSYTGAGDINNDVLLGGDIGTYVLTGNATPRPVARFYFQPSASMAGRTLYIPYQIVDDACPVRGAQSRVLVVNIRRANLLAIQANAISAPIRQGTVCVGGSISLSGFVYRPDSVRNVALGTTLRQQYGYTWTATGTAATSGLDQTQANNPLVNVTPLITTRYFLRVIPLLGFGTAGGGCGDTASVLVQVAAPPARPTVTRSGTALVSSAPTGNQWYRNTAAIPGATSSSITPTTSGSYTVVVNVGTGPAVCASPPSAAQVVTAAQQPLPGSSLHLAPNPTPDGHLDVMLTGYRQATTLTLFDMMGRLVYSATIAAPNAQGTVHPLDLSRLAAGVYALRVSTPGGTDVCRIVRQ